jgi:hypothetical protein
MRGEFYTLQDRRPEMLCISGDPVKIRSVEDLQQTES